MSFILDALKKSELERQRQSVPGLMDAGTLPARARFPRWAVALTGLLAVNLAVLTVVLTRGALLGPHTSSNHASAPAGGGSRPPERPFSPMDAAPPVYAPEIAPGDLSPPVSRARASDPVRVPDPVQHPAPVSAGRAHGGDPVLTRDEPADTEVLPSINELNLTGDEALPEMHLDVHVYATRPAERFVYINMHKYHEGNTLAEGPVLERIRRDGVILDYRGVRFLLPRQS